MKLSNESFLTLMEAVMAQAYADAQSSNKELKEEAEKFIEDMKNKFGN